MVAREKIEAALDDLRALNGRISETKRDPADELAISAVVYMAQHCKALEQALEAQMAGGWKLKQGMPMDEGVSFLVLWENDANAMVAVQVSWFQGDLYPDSLGSEVDYDDRINLAHITHWQPLPELPQEG